MHCSDELAARLQPLLEGGAPEWGTTAPLLQEHLQSVAVDADLGDRPPFTIVRIAEIVVKPEACGYKDKEKYADALRRCLLATSPWTATDSLDTLDPLDTGPDSEHLLPNVKYVPLTTSCE